jgi:type 1 glutamine amidotransferase
MASRLRPLLLGLLVAASAAQATAAEKLRLLIVDGQNNHNWKAMTPPMKAALEGSGQFVVDVATAPPKDAPADAWKSFRPEFARYDVVLSNYNGQPWPQEVREALVSYVEGGGGLVVIHAANNAFPEWPEWNRMIGLGWRDASFGDRVTVDDSGKVVRTPKGEGPSSGHGPQHEYTVVARDPSHPVMRGLPAEWRHARDELYHGQRGPAEDMHILATAFSATDQGGTGAHEPLVWTIPHGRGRVFTCLLGHAMGDDITALRCNGFRTLMLRGAEWAATGEVTLPVPADFPTEKEVRLAP